LAIDNHDEEQLEALKRWWAQHGNSLLFGVIAIFAVMFGFQQWQSSQTNTAAAASDLYQQISITIIAKANAAVTEDDLLAAQSVYSQLKSQHADSIYTRYAALAMAKMNVETNHLEQAAAELQWVLDNPKLGFMQKTDPELVVVATQRLARVRLAQGQPQQALDLLRATPVNNFAVSYAETEGDALLQLGDRDGAKAAYQKALAANTDGNPALLRLKLQDLGVSMLDSPQ
jgi:predicted negative regulator of RcsB-dependent stress response